MKRKIILHGYLLELYGEPIEVEADTVAEAIRALENIVELQREGGEPHHVTVDDIDNQIALFGPSDLAEIHVRPRLGGAGGRGGLMQILIGVAMIGLAWLNPAFLAMSSSFVSSLFLTGAMSVLGGLVQMLTPVPDVNENSERSRYLSGDVNTTQIGTRIAEIYGTRRWGGQYLSYDVDAKEVAPGETSSGTLTAPSYFVHDNVPGVVFCPVNPVYASATPTVGGVPISSWSP